MIGDYDALRGVDSLSALRIFAALSHFLATHCGDREVEACADLASIAGDPAAGDDERAAALAGLDALLYRAGDGAAGP